MNLKIRDLVEWTYNTPLNSGENRTIPLGAELCPFTVARGQDIRFMTFGVYSSHTFNLICEQCWRGDFGAGVQIIFTLPVLAATYTQPFALPAPQGDNGFIVLQGDYIRVRAVDTATAQHTQTNIYVAAWW